MRNLEQISRKVYNFKNASHCCYIQTNLVVASLTDGLVTVDRLTPSRRQLASFDAPDVAPEQSDKIIDIHYSEEDESICVILHGGDIVSIKLAASGVDSTVDIIGTIDQNITAAQWSPDGDVVALSTPISLNLLTKSFESLAEVPVSDNDVKASANQISVGWGRAETQFRGKHAPRDPTLPESVDEGTLSVEDDGETRISWRGDGQYLSLTSISKERRVIRVYTREGDLESTSEPINGHESLLTWKPSGNIIAAIQNRAGSTRQCIFFEKNGLRHGEFDLRRSDLPIDLQWNCDSTVLAVVYEREIELWVASNYHYALKSRMATPGQSRISWHPEVPLLFSIVSANNVLLAQFHWRVYTPIPLEPHDYGLVAMVDGLEIGLTPVRLANVPPPMSFRQLAVPEVPRSIAIHQDSSEIVVLFSDSIAVYTWDVTKRPVKVPGLLRQITLDLQRDEEPLQVICGVASSFICVLTSQSRILSISDQGQSIVQQESDGLTSIVPFVNDVISQTESGALSLISATHVKAFDPFPEGCHTVAVANIDDFPTVFGLAASGKLYANGTLISSKVTSFILVKSILALTTANYLKFVHLNKDFVVPGEDSTDERCRQIDRGSLLVCSSPSAQSITLQAPRGNLETIYPRLLVLSGVRKALDDLRWSDAWRASKVHRIDTNILCDHNPDVFMAHLNEFVLDLATSTELDLFLSALKPEDVSRTMYMNTLLDEPAVTSTNTFFDNKVNTICDNILEVLNESYDKSHLTSILTAHLAKVPADYEAALVVISKLPKAEIDDSVTHICFLADPFHLYNQALGLYDLPLALLLAQRSQRDPREYVPFLQAIQKMESTRQKFTLDDHLGRHPKAISRLLAIDDAWEESVLYIQRHALWQEALQLLKYDEPRSLKLYALYAEHLFEKQQFSEAAYAFEIVADYTRASGAFESAGLWREALYTASRAKVSVSDAAARLASLMIEQSKYGEAATIYKDYLHDIQSAIKMYCKAFDFSSAILLASSDSLMEDLVKPGLTEGFSQITELLSEMRLQLTSQIPRLRIVRNKRAENPEAYLDGTATESDADTPDNISLAGTTASTTASIYTRYSSAASSSASTTASKKSGKARRRMERQRARGKQGTVYEEEYLVNSTRRLIVRLEATRGDVRNLVVGLVRCGMRMQASHLQRAMADLVETCVRDNLHEVFGPRPAAGGGGGGGGTTTTTSGLGSGGQSHGQDGRVGEEPGVADANGSAVGSTIPVVERFECLSLC